MKVMSDFLLDSALQCYVMWWRTYICNFFSAKIKITTNRRHFTLTMATSDYSADHDFYPLFFRLRCWLWLLPTIFQITLLIMTSAHYFSDYASDYDFCPLFFRQNIFVPLRDMTVNYSQDFVTIVRCKDMVAFVTYCLYVKQFCKMPWI